MQRQLEAREKELKDKEKQLKDSEAQLQYLTTLLIKDSAKYPPGEHPVQLENAKKGKEGNGKELKEGKGKELKEGKGKELKEGKGKELKEGKGKQVKEVQGKKRKEGQGEMHNNTVDEGPPAPNQIVHIAEVHRALEADTTNNTPAVAIEALETDTTAAKPAVAIEALETDTTPAKPAVPVAIEALETDTTAAKPAVAIEALETDTTPAKPAVPVAVEALEADTTNNTPAVAVEALEADTTPAKPAVPVAVEALEADTTNNTPAVAVEALEVDTTPAKHETPKTHAINILTKLHLTPTVKRVNEMLPITEIVDTVRKAPQNIKKELFKGKSRVKRLATRIGSTIGLSRKYVHPAKKEKVAAKSRTTNKELKARVLLFLKREDNSYELPSKRDQVRGQGRYALTDTLARLHDKFLTEHPNESMCFSNFCNARTPNVRLIRYTNRKICLCKKCANLCLKSDVVKGLPKTPKGIIALTDNDIAAKLEDVPLTQKSVVYKQWLKQEVVGCDTKKTKLCDLTTTRQMFIYEFLEEMPEIRAHCHRISAQYEAVAHIRENIQPCLEVVCQMDYSENWVSKFFKEISAVYFDNAQFTLHPMVITFKTEEGELRTKTYVGVTRETSHSAATTFSFIKKLVTVLFDFLPALSVMHFVSDGPSNQYRNRTIVQLVRRFPQLFAGVRASWCWLESGHGKGPCDGVGGGIKKKADNLIKGGKIIRTIHEMAKCLEEAGSTSVMLKVTKAEIQETRDEMKEWQIPAVKGLMTTHMLAPKGDSMFIRTVACYKECCYAETNFMLACDGWANVEQKKKNKRKAQKAPKTEKAKKAKKTQKDDEDDDEDEEEYEVVVPKKTKKVKQPKKTKKEKGSDDEDDEDNQVPLLKVHTVGEKHATRQSARAAKPAVAVEEDLETDTHIAEVHQALETDTTPPKPAVAVDKEEDDVPLALLALETDTTPPKPAVAVEVDLETDTDTTPAKLVHRALETDTTPPKPAVAVDKEEDDVPLALLALETPFPPSPPSLWRRTWKQTPILRRYIMP